MSLPKELGKDGQVIVFSEGVSTWEARVQTSRCKDVEITLTEIKILRETAKRLRWIGATVTADVMQGIVDRWEAQ